MGRQRELSILNERLSAAALGDGGVVLVAGEPGIGKTRLVTEVADQASANGWQLLAGQAYEAEGMPPYLPFAEALRECVAECPPDLLAVLHDDASEIALLVPEVRDRLPETTARPSLSPDYQRYRLFEAVSDFLIALGRAAPGGLLLVLDDLQWADRSSLLLLRHLVRRIARAPVLVVGTYRTVDLHPSHPLQDLLAELSREGQHERILFNPFAPEEAANLIAALAGTQPAPDVATAIYRETAGNPFFLREMVGQLQVEGRDLTDSRAALAGWGIPERARQVIGKRLARLSPAANQILQVGAVLGESFTLDLAQSVSGLDTGPLLDALDDALGAGLLREAGVRYRFSHDLIRETLSGELSAARRQRLHLRAAEALEPLAAADPAPYLTELARHYFAAAEVGGRDKAIQYARQAGDHVLSLLGYEEAAAHYQRALDLLGLGGRSGGEQACELTLALGDAQTRAGDVPAAKETFRRAAQLARDLHDARRLAQAALGFGGPRGSPGAVDPALIGLLDEALRALGNGDDALRAEAMARLAMELHFAAESQERRAALSDEAIALAHAGGDLHALAFALHGRHVAIWVPDSADERLAIATEIVRLAEQAGDVELAMQGHGLRTIDLLEQGDITGADVASAALARLADDRRQPYYRWQATIFLAMRALLDGRFAEGEDLAQWARTLSEHAHGAGAVQAYLVQRCTLGYDLGRLREVEPELRMMAEQHPATPSLRAAWRAFLVELHATLGDDGLEAARREFERLPADRLTEIPRDVLWLATIAHLAAGCSALGDASRAATLYDMLRPYPTHHVCWQGLVVAPAYRGCVAYYLGLLAATLSRWDDAARHFASALELHGRIGARPWLARTQRHYAGMLLARGRAGDRERADALLKQAGETAAALGMAPLREDVERLQRQRARSHPPAPGGLSEREVEVLRLIAAGKSNREIADILVISPNTVAHHVVNILAKTGTANRAEAASYAARHGLIS